MQDIAANGQMLVEQGLARRGIVVSANHGESVKDLSWLDFSYLRAISDDGKTILFEEEGNSTNNYQVFVRDVDGSAALALGDGYSLALSRDKRWALGQKLTDPVQEIWLLPVGPGEARRISPPNLQPLIAANFLSDGKRIIYIANEAGHPPRTWMQDLDGQTPRPVTPEGIFGWLVSPDDKWLLTNGRRRAAAAVQQASLVALTGGEVKEIPGLRPDDVILGWTDDNQLFAGTPDRQRLAFHLIKLNPFTGARTPVRDLYGPAISGVFPDPPIFTPDGATYGFDYRLRLADLYVVSGIH
jgi:dipeptidyl aminopeptidase/acylaminoacyl peptidase